MRGRTMQTLRHEADVMAEASAVEATRRLMAESCRRQHGGAAISPRFRDHSFGTSVDDRERLALFDGLASVRGARGHTDV